MKFIHATHVGHTALWVVFVLFTLGLIGVFILSQRVEKRARLFHWLSALVLTIAMVSYFAMAAGLGVTYVSIPYHDPKASDFHFFRETYYARSIDWLLTTPLLLVSLGFLSGLAPYETVLLILADVFMIVTGLLSSFVSSRWASGERARWGFYAVSCVAFLYIFWILIFDGLKASQKRGRKARGLFSLLAGMTLILWTAYPIVYALAEGANRISVDAEIIAYAVLDVSAKIGFTYLLLFLHGHGDDDNYILPDWFVEHRHGLGQDGRGNYGAIGNRDD